MFLYNSDFGVNFCGENFCWRFFSLESFLRIVKKSAKIAKIRTRKNLVPHGRRLWLSLLLRDSRYIGKKPVKNCLNARAKMTRDKFDDEHLLARKTNENKMKNG